MNNTAPSDLILVDELSKPSSRLRDLSFRSSTVEPEPPLVPPLKVRVLLPEGYHHNSECRYPVLYLYHGGNGDYTSWTDPGKGDAAVLTKGVPAIVVMPEGGPAGFYVNWYNRGEFGSPQWETFHVEQLIPWIDTHYRTIPERRARAAAGASMGGHGALSYAAKHPEIFGVAASFSGAVDLTHSGLGIHASAQQELAHRIFGSYSTHEARWRSHSATDLAANLTATDISLYSGDNGGVETTILESTRTLHRRLTELGIEHRFRVNPGQSHSWENFRASLEDWLPRMMTTRKLH